MHSSSAYFVCCDTCILTLFGTIAWQMTHPKCITHKYRSMFSYMHKLLCTIEIKNMIAQLILKPIAVRLPSPITFTRIIISLWNFMDTDMLSLPRPEQYNEMIVRSKHQLLVRDISQYLSLVGYSMLENRQVTAIWNVALTKLQSNLRSQNIQVDGGDVMVQQLRSFPGFIVEF